MTLKYADRIGRAKVSEIREIQKFIKPGLVSFAGGLPAPEFFPVKELTKITMKVLEQSGSAAFQYTPSEGYIPLREKIVERMNKLGVETSVENILIVNGSQQGLDLSGKIFLNPDDIVICESPSYLGAINAFKTYECNFIEVPTDNNGMKLEELEKILTNIPKAKMIYVIPDFQNPTGKTWSVERRKKLLDVANKFNIPIIEDNPYGELRFEGEKVPPIKSFDTDGRVIFLGTFSKILCPGFRIGWICADEKVLENYIIIKQAADLQCNPLTQRQITLFLDEYNFDNHIEKLIAVYKKRRDAMISIIRKEFPQGVNFSYPEGGFFIWIELPQHINARDLLKKTQEYNVVFVPGDSFCPNGGHENYFRLNFSNMAEDKIISGMRKISEILWEEISK
jgi:2-aminoadipate transaminase